MINTKKMLILTLVIPIFALIGLTAYKKYILSFGREFELPISGYDPRDLLAGHYLQYQIDYGMGGLCASGVDNEQTFVCLDPREFLYTKPSNCRALIEGTCTYGRFVAGIEKFFVPEEKAIELEQMIRDKPASIILSVTENGRVLVKELLIDGKPWNHIQK